MRIHKTEKLNDSDEDKYEIPSFQPPRLSTSDQNEAHNPKAANYINEALSTTIEAKKEKTENSITTITKLNEQLGKETSKIADIFSSTDELFKKDVHFVYKRKSANGLRRSLKQISLSPKLNEC